MPIETATSQLISRLGVMGYTLQTSTLINGLWIQPNEIQKHLSRYAQRFICDNECDKYQFAHLGTATGIKIDGRYITISTNHQRKLGTDGKLGIICDPGKSAVLPHRMWIIKSSSDIGIDDDFDWCAYEFEPEQYGHRQLSSQFFNVGNDEVGIQGRSGSFALNLGFPQSLQNIDYYEDIVALTIASNVVEIIGKTSTDNVYHFKTLSEDRLFEDGMSGSPVFEIYRSSNLFKVRWLGVVVRGGRKSRIGRVICANHIVNHLRKQFASS